MRRIYESAAVRRDDDDPFRPNERRDSPAPTAARTVPVRRLSDTLVPAWLRYRAVSLSVSTPRTVYDAGEPIPFTVAMKNAAPFPITVPTRSPLPWAWYVDGARSASRVPEPLPERSGAFVFDRGERKVFDRTWNGTFRVSDSEWKPAAPGDYTISAAIDVADPSQKGVHDRTTVRIE